VSHHLQPTVASTQNNKQTQSALKKLPATEQPKKAKPEPPPEEREESGSKMNKGDSPQDSKMRTTF
jgi:hypothetical protein